MMSTHIDRDEDSEEDCELEDSFVVVETSQKRYRSSIVRLLGASLCIVIAIASCKAKYVRHMIYRVDHTLAQATNSFPHRYLLIYMLIWLCWLWEQGTLGPLGLWLSYVIYSYLSSHDNMGKQSFLESLCI